MNTVWWNTVRYSFFSKFYNAIVQPLELGRKRAIETVSIQNNENVLILGAGTGLDLEYLPTHAKYTAIDITSSMLQLCEEKGKTMQFDLKCIVMDGQQLEFDDATFDVVILNLILAVIPDPIACIHEVQRVLKPNGRVVIFDKFIPDNAVASLGRKCLNLFTRFSFSDINRKLGPILHEATSLQIVSRESAPSTWKLLQRMHYEIILLQKNKA